VQPDAWYFCETTVEPFKAKAKALRPSLVPTLIQVPIGCAVALIGAPAQLEVA